MLDTGGSSFYPALWVYRPDGTELCWTIGNPLANVNCALDATGTYTILAGDNSGVYTGSFNLFIERLNNPGEPTPIAFSQTLSETVTIQPELAAFTFEASAGDRVRLRMLDTGGSVFYPALWVYRPDGTELCWTIGDPLANVNCALDANGTYTVLAGDNSGVYTGSFNLFIERLNNPGEPTPITFGPVRASAIITGPELKAFSFTASAEDRLVIRMLDTGGTQLYPAFWVYRPDGTDICWTIGNPVADSHCALDTTGTYTILAGDNSGVYTGSFNIFLQNLDRTSIGYSDLLQSASHQYHLDAPGVAHLPVCWRGRVTCSPSG